jgi:hypothetical protein
MAQNLSARGYDSSFRGSIAPGAFYQILTSDFGEPIPGAPTLTLRAASGTLASSTANVQLTWITAEGVSLPSTSTAILVSAANDGLSIVIPTVPTTGSPVIGYQIYSQGSTGAPLLNSSATGTSPAPQTFTTTQGAVVGFPVATTTNFLNSYGTGAGVPVIDRSGIQPAIPTVTAAATSSAAGAGGTLDYDYIVPNSGSQWKTYKSVGYMKPLGVAETAGISMVPNLDCLSPLYPGATPGATTYTQVAVTPGTYMTMNGNLFISTLATNSTAATFIGGAAFAVAKGATVTDGSVTWLCLGKAQLVRAHYINNSSAALQPVQQEIDIFQL